MDGKLLEYQYKEHISDFRLWIEKVDPYECVLYKQNIVTMHDIPFFIFRIEKLFA